MEAHTINIGMKQVATSASKAINDAASLSSSSSSSSSLSMVQVDVIVPEMMIMMSSKSWTPATVIVSLIALFIRLIVPFPESTIKTIIPATRTTRNRLPSTMTPKSIINNENNQPPGKQQLYHHHHDHHHYHIILKSTMTKQLQLLLFIFALLFVSHFGCTTATPVPSIVPNSGPSSKHETESTGSSSSSSSLSEGVKQQPIQSVQQQQQHLGGASSSNHLENNLANSVSKVGKTNTAEKLKRGLTNFMNQLNPAPFFVPPQLSVQAQQQQQQAGSEKPSSTQPNSSSAEPATIVNSDSSLVLKGPANRWAFARPIGGPLRWGKR